MCIACFNRVLLIVLTTCNCSQVLASNALTSLCTSSGGGENCTYAEQDEIDVLLEAFKSSCLNVRDAALRVSVGHSYIHFSFGFHLLLQ